MMPPSQPPPRGRQLPHRQTGAVTGRDCTSLPRDTPRSTTQSRRSGIGALPAAKPEHQPPPAYQPDDSKPMSDAERRAKLARLRQIIDDTSKPMKAKP